MYKKSAALFLFILLFGVTLSAQNLPDGYTKIKEVGGITEYRLDSNGLSVLLSEDHSTPVLTFMVTYHVGSRNEVTGTTGATHLLEHLMFKGTEKYNKANGNHIDVKLGNIGARLNATTWNDRTNYFESIPSNYLEVAVDIESDRMRNLLLRKEDKDAEMTVVRNEFERGENSPFQALDKQIWAAAYIAHPYHHSTIGWRSDIENVPMSKLRDFYNTYYWPNNATVTVIGDFNTNNALEIIKKYYGKISKAPHEIPQVYTTEPEQQGERRVIVNRAGQLGVVGVGYKVPKGLSHETYALSVLDKILTEGKSSRFYKALIDKNVAVNVFDYYVPFRDPGMFIPYVFLAPGVKHEDAEKIVLNQVDSIKQAGVTQEEVTRAINQIAAETAYGRDGSYSIASQLNEAIAIGDWTFYATFLDSIKNVTPQDVQNVVKQYFTENNCTVGYFIPQTPGGGSQASNAGSKSYKDFGKQYYRDPDLEEGFTANNNNETNNPSLVPADDETSITKNIERKKTAGIDVITAKTGVKDVITFRGTLAAGDVFSGDNSVIADLTGNMLDKGTTKHDKSALAEQLENLGASINFSVSKYGLDFDGKCLTKDIGTVINLLAEQLRYPAFSQDEFDKLKTQRKGSFRQQMDNTNSRATTQMNDLLFPKEHPNYDTPIDQMITDVDKATLDDIKTFYKKYYGPKSMIFVAIGDLDPKIINKDVSDAFNGWEGGVDYPDYPKAKMQTEGVQKVVFMGDKTSATLMIGQTTGLKEIDPDYLPLSIANSVFGLGGFAARLMSIIRDDEGLTYGIYSFMSNDVYADGSWTIQGTFSPALLQKGINSTKRELKRWVKDGITQTELDASKTRNIGSYKVGLATTGGLASRILSFVRAGHDISYLDKYPDEIQALTLDKVNSVLRKYIDPDKVVTVIAGTVDDNAMPVKSETK